MSALVPVNGVPQKPSPVYLTGTGETDILVAPTENKQRMVTVASVALANNTASGVLLSLFYNDGSSSYLLWKGTIGAHASLADDIPGLPLHLSAGTKLTAQAGAGNAVTVTPSSLALG